MNWWFVECDDIAQWPKDLEAGPKNNSQSTKGAVNNAAIQLQQPADVDIPPAEFVAI